jgi:hypothetical protein
VPVSWDYEDTSSVVTSNGSNDLGHGFDSIEVKSVHCSQGDKWINTKPVTDGSIDVRGTYVTLTPHTEDDSTDTIDLARNRLAKPRERWSRWRHRVGKSRQSTMVQVAGGRIAEWQNWAIRWN